MCGFAFFEKTLYRAAEAVSKVSRVDITSMTGTRTLVVVLHVLKVFQRCKKFGEKIYAPGSDDEFHFEYDAKQEYRSRTLKATNCAYYKRVFANIV